MTSISEAARQRDQDLWQRWKGGDEDAATELLHHYDAALHRAMRRLGVRERGEMEELYAELILLLSEYLEKNDLHSSFFGLARRMLLGLVHRSRDRQRREQSHSALEDDQIAAPPDPAPSAFPFQEALHLCLDKLRKPLEQELFRQRFLLGNDNQTLAQRYGKTSNHIAVIIHGAVQQMRHCLTAQGFAP